MNDKDLKIRYYKGGGAGGQHRNKVESCVEIIHEPTGLKQSCCESRSKIQNLETAKKLLSKKLKDLEEQKLTDKIDEYRRVAINKGRIRTYDFKQGIVINHTNGKTANLKDVLDGDIESIQ